MVFFEISRAKFMAYWDSFNDFELKHPKVYPRLPYKNWSDINKNIYNIESKIPTDDSGIVAAEVFWDKSNLKIALSRDYGVFIEIFDVYDIIGFLAFLYYHTTCDFCLWNLSEGLELISYLEEYGEYNSKTPKWKNSSKNENLNREDEAMHSIDNNTTTGVAYLNCENISNNTIPTYFCNNPTTVDAIMDKINSLNVEVSKIESGVTEKEKENRTMNKFDFGPVANDRARISMYGIAVKNQDGAWVAFNNNKIIDVETFAFEASRFLYKMPVALTELREGDVIIHNNQLYIILSQPNMAEYASVKCICPATGKVEEVVPTRSIFGFNFITKIINFMDGMMGNPSEINPFGNMLPFLMMDGADKKDNDSLMMAMMMMNQGAGQMNPMMMYLMMGDDKKNDNMLLAMMMMNQNQMNDRGVSRVRPVAEHNCNCGCNCHKDEEKSETVETE